MGWTWGLEGGSGQWSSNPALFPWHTQHVLWDQPVGTVPGSVTSPAPASSATHGHWEHCREACGQQQAPWPTLLGKAIKEQEERVHVLSRVFQNRGASASTWVRSAGPECQPGRHRDGEAWAGVWAGWPRPQAPVSNLPAHAPVPGPRGHAPPLTRRVSFLLPPVALIGTYLGKYCRGPPSRGRCAGRWGPACGGQRP